MKIYLVGGAVRDKLLDRTVKEKDYVVVGATVDKMLEQGFQPVGKAFPVFLHPKTKEEYALARTEKKVSKGYHGFTFYAEPDVSLEQDLMRRDLTINAIAEDDDGTLIDPYYGQQDLEAKLLRHVSDAFAEDPVRILRVARFAARFHHLGFTIAPETMELMKNMVLQGEVNALVPERVWRETQSALCEQNPEVFFETLRECGALAVLFPSINALWGVPQNPKSHPEVDCGIHTMLVLQACVKLTDDPVIRFAALMHDLGKSCTPEDLLPSHPNHEVKSAELVDAFCAQYRVPNDYHGLAKLVAFYHTLCHQAMGLSADELLAVLEGMDIFRRPERLEPFLTACLADCRGRPTHENDDYPQADRLRQAFEVANSVNTGEIAKAHKGPAIKDAIHLARAQAIQSIL